MYDKDTFLQKLKEENPNVYLYGDSPYSELIYKPIELLRSDIYNEILLIERMLKLDATLSKEEIDRIASNFLVQRADGSSAKGYVTIYMAAPVSFDPSKLEFTTQDGLKFKSRRVAPITINDFVNNNGVYSVTIEAESEEPGEVYNIKENEISFISNIDVPYLYTTNIEFVGGSDSQNNEQMIEAIKNAVTDRSLTRKTGVITRLMSKFFGEGGQSDIAWIHIVGSGDPLLKRDIYNIGTEKIRLGNKTDVYI